MPQGKNFQTFFLQFSKLSQLGKNMHTSYQLGKTYAFPHLFFPQHVIWPYFPLPARGGAQWGI